MTRQHRTPPRTGAVLPLIVICLIGILGLIALGVDIGVVAIARTQAQGIADLAALAGARELSGDSSNSANLNNINGAISTATDRADDNRILGAAVTAAMVTKRVGVYNYNSGLQRFDPSYPGSPGTEAWSAMEVTVTTTTPTYFGRVFGVNSFNVAATATAAHRPRDLALILDFSGSMRYGCQTGWPSSGDLSGSLNPDPVHPKFGHWSAMASVMQRTTDYLDSGGEVHAANNLTFDTSGGPPIVLDFLTKVNGAFENAFHKAQAGTYDALQTPVATPAPSDFDVQSSTTATYVGDQWPRLSQATTGNYAKTVQEYLFGNNTVQSDTHAKNVLFELNGYGLNFKGYAMGPGYYGKTFFIWPPDPRTPVGDPGDAVYVPGDWRKRFYYNNGTTTALDDNARLFDSATGMLRQAGTTGAYSINYTAVVKWLKHSSQPQVLPPNLRAGRLLYYDSIPDTIPSSGGTLDQMFWRQYINFVLGTGDDNDKQRSLYGWETGGWGGHEDHPEELPEHRPPRPAVHAL